MRIDLELGELKAALDDVRRGREPGLVMAELCAARRREGPSVGQVVHMSSGGRCRAATVTEVVEDTDKLGRRQPVHLLVMCPDGVRTVWHVPRADHTGGDGTWHWPQAGA